MKGALGGAFFIFALGWLVWAVSPESPCERARRGATPVAAIGGLLRAGLEHWLGASDRTRLLLLSMEAEEATREFLAKQFYGSLDCARKVP